MLRELLIGIAGGTLSGISPGIHVNTLAALLSDLGPGDNLTLFAMGLTHTFLDVIPSAFLGVPDEGSALGVLPAHRLVLKGKAIEVIRIALWASFLSVIMAIPLMPLYSKIAPLYRPLYGRIAVILLAGLLVLTEKGTRRLYAAIVFLLAGILGMLTFRLALNQPFYHLFTGFFGIPVIAAALLKVGRLPEVRDDVGIGMEGGRFLAFSALGTVLGGVASLVPAFTASQAALVGSFFSRDERSFLTVVFSVNTSNFLFSTFNFLLTGRQRNGIVVLMEPQPRSAIGFYLLVALFVSMVVLLYGEPLARLILSILRRVNYRVLNASVLALLVALSWLFDGLLGLLVLTGASMVGFLAQEMGVKRTNCMGVLMLPILLRM
ncbi:tripartite tricarboxylate transporter permease [Thermococcus sp.]|uniref:tripartite tricarboxylate transporter permease n=1 Tax=Thermococcus sp. TaxID=35749 RepID=UPI0026383635|nr:tripartite tricarboxylate transporter permease [Thermococcus sp.]